MSKRAIELNEMGKYKSCRRRKIGKHMIWFGNELLDRRLISGSMKNTGSILLKLKIHH